MNAKFWEVLFAEKQWDLFLKIEALKIENKRYWGFIKMHTLKLLPWFKDLVLEFKGGRGCSFLLTENSDNFSITPRWNLT